MKSYRESIRDIMNRNLLNTFKEKEEDSIEEIKDAKKLFFDNVIIPKLNKAISNHEWEPNVEEFSSANFSGADEESNIYVNAGKNYYGKIIFYIPIKGSQRAGIVENFINLMEKVKPKTFKISKKDATKLFIVDDNWGNLSTIEIHFKSQIIKPNKGDVSEGLFGAALAARFMKRDLQGDDFSEINEKDIIDVILKFDYESAKKNKEKVISQTFYEKGIKDLSVDGKKTKSNDNITLTVQLAKINFIGLLDFARDESWRKDLSNITRGIIDFANSEFILDKHRSLAFNNLRNSIKISSMGLEDQKGSKIDLSIIIDDEELPFMRFSLKAGATKQVGQRGQDIEKINKLFKDLFNVNIKNEKLKNQWNDELSKKGSERDLNKIKDIGRNIYYEIEKDISKNINSLSSNQKKKMALALRNEILLSGDIDRGFLLHFTGKATKGKSFHLLSFNAIEDVFSKLTLSSEFRETKYPEIVISGMLKGGSPKPLFSIRMKHENKGTVRNYVEKQDWFVELFKHQMIKNKDKNNINS